MTMCQECNSFKWRFAEMALHSLTREYTHCFICIRKYTYVVIHIHWYATLSTKCCTIKAETHWPDFVL